MATSKSDKPLVRNLIIGVAATIALFVGVFIPEFKYFSAGLGALVIAAIAATGYLSYKAYVTADDPNKDYFRKGLIATALVAIVAIGLKGSTVRSEKAEGIPGEYGNVK